MGQSHVSAAGTLIALFAAPLLAQGPLYRERWGYLHLELRRDLVLRELAGRDLDTRQKVGELLVADDKGIPFLPVAKALALLRAVPADPAFVVRTMASAFVLPEVVDPEAANEECRLGHVSMFLPYSIELPGKVTFAVEVVDHAGARVFAGTIERDTDLENLRMGRAAIAVPAAELPDGDYRVRVQTLIDGDLPRAADPMLEHHFGILRGYQQRAEKAMLAARERDATLPPVPRALLRGLASEVARAYAGEAFEVRSTGVADLLAFERALDNLAADRPLTTGVAGTLIAALPVGDQQLGAAIRWPAVDDTDKKPLLVFAAGSPAYDVQARRPSSPASRSPRWLLHALRDFDREGRFRIACLESPGNGVLYGAALEQGVAALRTLLPVMPGATVLVAEREAAVAATFHPKWLASDIQGIALVGAGSLGAPQLQQLGSLQILACSAHGHPSSAGLQRVADLIAGKHGTFEFGGKFELLSGEGMPWPFVLPLRLPEIAAFAQRVVATR
ncbi:MAG: hypothetical protein IPK26_11980 [Planctomycetes bacterium]|nr:hypothetical protein [Planctomycetota bacterium]